MSPQRVPATADHEATIRRIFEGAGRGDPRPLLDSLHDDVRWTILGTTAISGRYEGKAALLAVFAGFGSRFREGGVPIFADALHRCGDTVVVQGRGSATTVQGEPYANTYCWVYRFAGDKIVEVTEYLDTELARRAFG